MLQACVNMIIFVCKLCIHCTERVKVFCKGEKEIRKATRMATLFVKICMLKQLKLCMVLMKRKNKKKLIKIISTYKLKLTSHVIINTGIQVLFDWGHIWAANCVCFCGWRLNTDLYTINNTKIFFGRHAYSYNMDIIMWIIHVATSEMMAEERDRGFAVALR
jgi:hypothetical protein